MDNLQHFISEMKLEGKVILMGKTNDVFSAIANSRVFILSSNYEGMPNALLEAMCIGLPCISTRVSGATELIQSGTNGILVDVNDRKQLVDAMVDIVDNPEKAEKLAGKASELYNTIRLDIIQKEWTDYVDGFLCN
jgi:glycosyltransferase involved in cell wall biosynthesis